MAQLASSGRLWRVKVLYLGCSMMHRRNASQLAHDLLNVVVETQLGNKIWAQQYLHYLLVVIVLRAFAGLSA